MISQGNSTTLFVKLDDSHHGQSTLFMIPSQREHWLAPVSGSHQCCMIVHPRGIVYLWGTFGFEKMPTKPEPLRNIENIVYTSCGYSFYFLLTTEGKLLAWGQNDMGQLGIGNFCSAFEPKPLDIPFRISHVDCGQCHTAAIDEYGNLYTWGFNGKGQLGLEDRNSRPVPTPVPGLGHVQSVSCGNAFTVCCMQDGSLYTFGDNSQGQLGINDPNVRMSATPRSIPRLTDGEPYAFVAAGAYHTLCLTNQGHVYSWGGNSSGQLGVTENQQNHHSPQLVALPAPAVFISCGSYHSAACLQDGRVYTWGGNFFGQLGVGHSKPESRPTEVKKLPPCRYVVCAAGHTKAVDLQGNLYSWGTMEQDCAASPLDQIPSRVENIQLATLSRTKAARRVPG